MTTSSLHAVMEFERAALEEVRQSLQAHLALEQAVLAQLESAWTPAAAEAAAAGMDLETYVAALSAEAEGPEGQAWAEAHAEAAAAGVDLETYASALAEAEMTECAGLEAEATAQLDPHSLEVQALAEHEAAEAGMDLATYVAVLAEAEAAEIAHLEAQGGYEFDAAATHTLAEQEAAQAGMDLPTYLAALQEAGAAEDEQAVLEEMAYQEGLALHQAELAELHGLHGLTPYEIALLQHQQLAQHQALGLLR